MEAKTKQMLFSLIHAKFPGMDAEIDIDWDIAEISYKAGIKEVTDDMKLAVTTGTADIVDLIIKYEAKLKEWHIEPD